MGSANHDELSDNAEIICYISDNYPECQSLQPSLGDSPGALGRVPASRLVAGGARERPGQRDIAPNTCG